MRIINRLDKYIETKGINDNQITVNCDLSVGLLGKARKGKSDLGKKTIEKILNFYTDIERVWFLTGEGNMLKSETQASENINECMNPESISVSELMKALNNVSEAAKINAVANERNSRNVEKMLDMIRDKDKQNDKKGDASPKALKQDDAAHIVSSPPVGSKK